VEEAKPFVHQHGEGLTVPLPFGLALARSLPVA
jgi:hypothetical protein